MNLTRGCYSFAIVLAVVLTGVVASAGPATSPELPVAQLGGKSVLRVERMATRAVSFYAVGIRVLGARNHSKVIWVDAAWIPTLVVYGQTIGNRPTEMLPRKPVGHVRCGMLFHLTIPALIPSGGPFPAPSRWVYEKVALESDNECRLWSSHGDT